MEPNASTIGILAHGAIAFLGGLVHALDRHRKGKTRGFGDVMILTVISSFSGVVFGLLALNLFAAGHLTLAITAAGGYLGVEGLSVIAEKLRDVLVKK